MFCRGRAGHRGQRRQVIGERLPTLLGQDHLGPRLSPDEGFSQLDIAGTFQRAVMRAQQPGVLDAEHGAGLDKRRVTAAAKEVRDYCQPSRLVQQLRF
jgi:hypothetical protein